MFLCAFAGFPACADQWRVVVGRHAAWLKLEIRTETVASVGGNVLILAFLMSPSHPASAGPLVMEAPPYLITTTHGVRQGFGRPLPADETDWQHWLVSPPHNVPLLRIAPNDGAIDAFVPLTSAEQVLYVRDGRGLSLSTDLRFLIRWGGFELEPRAAFAQLMFGQVPAPLTLARSVHRVAPGSLLRSLPTGDSQTPLQIALTRIRAEVRDPASEDRIINGAIDSVLSQLPSSSLLYFSGGVDSTLLALRLRHLGRSDVPLINYCFDVDAPRASLPFDIARRLGFRCERIVYRPADLTDMFARIALDYTFPVGGRSVIPTNLMVHQAHGMVGHVDVAVEGTGADGLFGIEFRRRQWQSVYRLPGWLRRAGGCLHAVSGNWLRDPQRSRMTFYGGVLGRSGQIPSRDAVLLAQNPLNGIAYDVPKPVLLELVSLFEAIIEPFAKLMSPSDRFALLDVACIGAGEFAAKCYDPLRRLGTEPVFPYLEPPMLEAAWSLPWASKCPGGQTKAPLKRLLAQQLPADWFHLPKEGFIPPFQRMLRSAALQALLHDVVLAPSNPLLAYCRPQVIRRMITCAGHGKLANYGAQRFLWSLTIAAVWWQQLGSSAATSAAPPMSKSTALSACPRWEGYVAAEDRAS